MKTTTRISRRQFLAASAATAIGPMILPSGVLAAPGRPGANDKIITGHIGVGGQGMGLLNAFNSLPGSSPGALCDADSNQLERAVKALGRKIPTYKDYRELLEQSDLDAVVIATPDHWHGIQTVQACQAGKDIYVEKPLSRTVEEGQAMKKAAARYGRIIQVGSQGRSTPAAHAACTYIRNGQLGDIKQVDCWHVPNYTGGDPLKNGPAPPELDWDLWLGPQRWVPYNPDRVHFNFRWMLDYGDGFIRDRGAHVFSVIMWCLDFDKKLPSRVTASGVSPKTGLWDVPTTFEATFEYKNPDIVVTWKQPGEPAADTDFGAVYRGTKDTLIVRGGDGGCGTEDKALNYVPPADGQHMFKSPGHQQNWLDCIRSRQMPHMSIFAGHAVATMCNLATISYKLGRTVEWDNEKEKFINDEQANLMLASPGRGPWHI